MPFAPEVVATVSRPCLTGKATKATRLVAPMILDDKKFDDIFEDAARHVRSSVLQSRLSILRDSRRRLAKDANDSAAAHVIAAAHLQDRRPESSLSLLRKVQPALVDNATGLRIAGYAYLANEQLASATEHFGQAVKIDPTQHDSWTMLGELAERAGECDAAITYYRRAVVIDDHSHDSALALSRMHAERRELQDAIDTLRVSLLHDQRSAKLNLALARMLERRAMVLRRSRRWQGESKILEEACLCYRVVLASAPTAIAYEAYGSVLQRLQRHVEAAEAFEKAVRLDPDSAKAVTQLASSHVENGNIDLAVTQFRRSIELDPSKALTHFRYTRAQRFRPSDDSTQYANLLSGLLQQPGRPVREQVHLNFALAKVSDDIGDYDRAWQHYDRGNRLKPVHGSHGTTAPDPLRRVADATIDCFTREFIESRRDLGNSSATPIFVVGMPRSGTTLTEQILSSHPDVVGAGELKHIERIRRCIERDLRPLPNRSESPSRRDQAGKHRYPHLLHHVRGNQLRDYADGHVAFLETMMGRGSRVSDKMPTNFVHLGLISILFPNATIIHCRRHPMDVLVSAYCQNLNAPFCDVEGLVRYHRQYRRLMAHWQEVLPGRVHAVDYESLVTDPEVQVRSMIDHCRLTWDESCLAFHENKRSVHTPSKWQVRQPLYSSSVGRWKRFEPQLGEVARRIEEEMRQESLGEDRISAATC